MLLRLIAALALALVFTTAHAEFRMIVPQAQGNGTAVWADIIARHLEKQLGERVIIQHIPGAKDIPGFDRFHTHLRSDDTVIMVSHGGNAVGYLVDRVQYDYAEYDSIGMMNLNIVLGKHKDVDIFNLDRPLRVAGTSGQETDGMAIGLLICGNLDTIEEYLACWDERVVWINGMSGGERRLAFMRGEIDVARESVVAWNRNYTSADANAELWMHHGVYDLATGMQEEDPNFPAGYMFGELFEAQWGEAPRGPLYEVYSLSRNFRDVLQKALWVNKGNPNTERLRAALETMITDPDALAALEADTGVYEWIIGEDGNQVVDRLRANITHEKLQNMVLWHEAAYRFPSVYKPELVVE